MTIEMERYQERCNYLLPSLIFISTIADATWCFYTIAVNVTSLPKMKPNDRTKCFTSNEHDYSFKCFVHINVLSLHNKHLLSRKVQQLSRFVPIIFITCLSFLLRFEKSSLRETQSIDRELFLELIEYPLNLAFLHVCLHRQGMNVIQCSISK